MTVIGSVKHGQIVLPQDICLPDGTQVAIEVLQSNTPGIPVINSEVVIKPSDSPETPRTDEEPIDGYALNRALMKFAGIFKGYPEDSSVNLDHYLYGVPKNP